MSILKNRYFAVFIVIFAALLLLLMQPRNIIKLQVLFDIPGQEITVGSARIIRPANWLLTSSREGEGHSIKYFGVLPGWIYQGKGPPEERYFTFSDGGDESSSFTFIETDEVKRRKVATIVAGAKPEKGGCAVKSPALAGYDGVECVDDASVVIYLPDLGVTVVVLGQSSSQLSGLKISKL